MIVAAISVTILAASGCAGLGQVAGQAARPIPPPRPTLETLTVTPDGGICMGREDAADLLLYIDTLEEMAR